MVEVVCTIKSVQMTGKTYRKIKFLDELLPKTLYFVGFWLVIYLTVLTYLSLFINFNFYEFISLLLKSRVIPKLLSKLLNTYMNTYMFMVLLFNSLT